MFLDVNVTLTLEDIVVNRNSISDNGRLTEQTEFYWDE